MDATAAIELSSVVVLASACDTEGVIGELTGPDWPQRAKVIKSGPRGMVAAGPLVTLDGRMAVVKTHRLVGVRDLGAAFFERSRLARQARGARMLEGAGAPTAQVWLLIRGTDATGARVEVLVLEFVPGVSVAHHASRGDLHGIERRALARALGTQVARIASARLVNADHKASNIVVRRGTAVGPMPVVVDTVGVRRCHPAAARVRMLFGLVVELVGLGIAPGRTDRMRVVREAVGGTRQDRKRAWRAVDALVRIHGDAKPKDDPLVDPHLPTGA